MTKIRIKILVLVLILMLLIVGCDSTKQVNKLQPMPDIWFTNFPMTIDDTYPIYPSSITLSNLHEDSIIDTWVEDNKVDATPELPEDKKIYYPTLSNGSWMTVNIHNKFADNQTFNLYFRTPDSNYDYHPEAAEIKDWIEIASNRIEVPSESIVHIPVRIIIPKKATVPNTEFWIDVIRETTGSAQYGGVQRWIMIPR